MWTRPLGPDDEGPCEMMNVDEGESEDRRVSTISVLGTQNSTVGKSPISHPYPTQSWHHTVLFNVTDSSSRVWPYY